MNDIDDLAARLDEAALSRRPMPQLGLRDRSPEVAAYAIQERLIERRLARGERLIGVKLGFTSRAKMAQMGVHDVIWGRLTDRMIADDGGTLDLTRFIHPRIEPEIAFLVGQRLAGHVSTFEAQAAIAAIAPAIEVIDSRYADFKFDLQDVIADNCSAAGFIVGPWHPLIPGRDLGNLGVLLEIDGRLAQCGSTAAILGHPLRALVAVARLLAAEGAALEPGTIVLAGAATAAERLRPGAFVRLSVEQLGTVSLHTSGVGVPA